MTCNPKPRFGRAGSFPRDEGLIRLSGTDFRRSSVSCPSCRWSGTAAELRTPDLDSLQSEVTYACPECERLVAVHAGLTHGEVLAEMRRIDQLLAAELTTVLVKFDVPGDEQRDAKSLDYQMVRERFPHHPSRYCQADLASVETAPTEAETADLSCADMRARRAGV